MINRDSTAGITACDVNTIGTSTGNVSESSSDPATPIATPIVLTATICVTAASATMPLVVPMAFNTGVGAEVLPLLEQHTRAWSLDERVWLREALRLIHQHGLDHLDELSQQLARLEDTVAPRSFAERLRQRVCVWQPEFEDAEDERLDDELAREGLQGELPLRQELSWLASAKAERGHVFAYAIGRCDEQASLFDDLRCVAAEHPNSWQAQALLGRC